MTIELQGRITRYGFIADLTKARKACVCNKCKGVILKGEHYYKIVIGGGGLQSLKFPDRTHVKCIEPFLERFKKEYESTEAAIKNIRERNDK